jgi:ribosomal protein L20A (L18A)
VDFVKTYRVYFVTSGYFEAEVEAESREEAIDIAYDDACAHGDPDWQFDWVESDD